MNPEEARAGDLGRAARLVNRGEELFFRAPALTLSNDVMHGLTHASLGNFSLTTADDPGEVERKRRDLMEALEFEGATLFAPPLHHGTGVGVVRGSELPAGDYDALTANESDVLLAVTVADCVPVYFVDTGTGAFGVAHAGWRGLAGRIVRKTIRAMEEAWNTLPGNLLVGVGPSIRGPNYEVGPEVSGLFPETFSVPVGEEGAGRAQLDLPSCALADAAGSGVPKDNLVDFALCTFDHAEDLFSHRRGDPERHWAFIGRS